jgi:hypothetical protein
VADREQVVAAVFAAVDELNEMLPEGEQLAKDEGARLTGDGAAIKSLSLANLLVGIEEQIEDVTGDSISIVGGDPLPEDPSPLETLGTMIDYVAKLLDEESS